MRKLPSTAFKPGLPRPPNSGRAKGTPNKKTLEVQKILELHNFSPAEALLECYADARKIVELRAASGNLVGALEALRVSGSLAESLASYVYPKKRAIEHSGEVGLKTWADFIAAALPVNEEPIDLEVLPGKSNEPE